MRRAHPTRLIVQGDNDPTDVVEIGSTRFATGDIVPVKILGARGPGLCDQDADETPCRAQPFLL